MSSCFLDNVSFISYFIILAPSVNGFAELSATLVSELGCHIGIHFKRIGFELYIGCLGWPPPIHITRYATAVIIYDCESDNNIVY